MAPWSAELELELACKVGSSPDFERAVNEGADVNWDGSAPLFLAIMGGHRHLITRLVELGADPSPFLGPSQTRKLRDRGAVVAALCEACPPPPEDPEEEPPGDPFDEFDGWVPGNDPDEA